MLRVALRSLSTNRIRLALTVTAVVTAVAFVASSFILTDGVRAAAATLSSAVATGADLEVRPTVDEFGVARPVDETLLTAVSNTVGVAESEPVLRADGQLKLYDADGQPIDADGAPQLTSAWMESPTLNPFALVVGQAPVSGEFSMDVDTANRHGFQVGSYYDLAGPTETSRVRLSGVVASDQPVDTLATVFMQLPTDDLQRLLGRNGYDAVQVILSEPADAAAVQARLTALGPDLEVVDRSTLSEEMTGQLDQDTNVLGQVLLGFAAISIFVAALVIRNTFAILLRQRTREFALLRAVGATSRQIMRSVIYEAVVLGIAASAIGLVAGLGVALSLREAFNALGASLPDTSLVLAPRTIVIGALVGTAITVVSSIGPARHAARVPVISALRRDLDARHRTSRRRLLASLTVIGGGVVAVVVGLTADPALGSPPGYLAAGAIALFVGVLVASPLIATPATRAIGWPVARLLGAAGRMGLRNLNRDPLRTSTTAAALMIGVTLVSLTLTVGESVKQQIQSSLTDTVYADYIVSEGESNSGYPVDLGIALNELPETETVVGFRYDDVKINGEIQRVSATAHQDAADLFDWDLASGVAFDVDTPDPVLVSDEEATTRNLQVGDTVPASFADGSSRNLTIIGIYRDDETLEEPYLLDLDTWDAVSNSSIDLWLAMTLADDVTAEQATSAFEPIVARYSSAGIRTTEDHIRLLQSFVDNTLVVVNLMVVLALLIALIGIANTLALAVIERTQEIGLLRSVGMTRRQVQRMVRCEAALIAMFGATLGVATGVALGSITVAALPSNFVSALAVPWLQLVTVTIIAGVASVAAAWLPARRASRLNVLEAVAA